MTEYDDDYVVPDEFDPPSERGDFHDQRFGNVSSMTRPSISYVNESGVPQDVLDRHMDRIHGDVASQIEKWSQSLSPVSSSPTLDVFNRTRWHGAKHIFSQMSQCAWAVENDDILSTTADVVEGLMWQKCRFSLFDEDQQDIWNQWAGEIDLDSRLRQFGREIFKVSQFYCGVWWEKRTYGVRDDSVKDTVEDLLVEAEKKQAEKNPELIPEPETKKKPGNRTRRKKFEVRVPTAFTIFDPTKVLPVGTLMFGRERFAYIASRDENEAFEKVMTGNIADGTVLKLIERKYTPTESDKALCAELDVDHSNLWLFNEDAIFRHSLTKAEYERFAPVRLKSILPLLEMKQHLRSSDRAALIGFTHFIVVITKGSDKLPAKQAEIDNLREQARVIARLPVLVGDHRLEVKIVSPSIENTLMETRWQVLDSRLVFKSLQSYSPVVQGGNASGTGVSEMSRVIAKGMESRRHMIVRSLERAIFRKILDRNEDLDEMPTLEFSPKRISLDFNADVIGQILKLRDRGDLSRESMLEEMDYDQEVEVLRRAKEKAMYDEVFQSGVPHSSPGMNPFGAPKLGPDGKPVVDPQQPGSNVGPNGQPRTEGGRPSGAKDVKPRAKKTATAAVDKSDQSGKED